MSKILEGKMDRYLRGELTPAQARELAQAALSDGEIFDALAAHGAVEQSLVDPEFGAVVSGSAKIVRFRRRALGVASAALAAAIAVFALYLNSRSQVQSRQSASVTSQPRSAKPLLITKEFAPDSSPNAPVFRGAAPDTRAPLPEGAIVAQDNFLVTINLGSLDGLSKGVPLDVFRAGSTQPTGRLEATTIFRDHARARIVSGAPHEHDRVRAEPSVYLGAVLEVMGSDRTLGRNAVEWALSNAVPPAAMRPLLDRLAPLDYQAGDFNAAEQDYQLLRDSAPTPDDRAEALNNLGAVAESQGQHIEDIRFRQVDRKSARGEQHVVKQGRSRPRAAQHKNRRGSSLQESIWSHGASTGRRSIETLTVSTCCGAPPAMARLCGTNQR